MVAGAIDDPFDEMDEIKEPEDDTSGDGQDEDAAAEGDEKTPTPGDEDADATDDKPDADASDDKAAEPTLEDRIKELERVNRGLLNAKRDEVRKRQDIESRFNQLNTTVADVLARRKDVAEEDADAEEEDERIPVEIDDDGKIYLKKSVLAEINKPDNKGIEDKVGKIESSIAQQQEQQQLADAFNRAISQVIGDDPNMAKSYGNLEKHYGWIDKQLAEVRDTEENFPKITSSGAALSVIEQYGLVEKFEKEFPGVDLGIVVHAFDSNYDLKRALKHITSATPEGDSPPADKGKGIKDLKKIAEKANSLADVRNQKDAATTTLDDIAGKDFEDLVFGMSDKEISELEKLLQAE